MLSCNRRSSRTNSPRRTSLNLTQKDIYDAMSVCVVEEGTTHRKRGVIWDKRQRKWRVRLMLNGTRRHIGYYTNYEQACQAVDDFRKKNGI
jgi:hypothetical protein